MAKKDKDNEDKSDTTENNSSKETETKIEFNLKDGVTWHDFVGIFVLIGQFFWKITRLVLAPIFWVYAENVRMVRFMRAKGHERILTDDERWFLETIPFVYTVTGVIGGILVGLFAALSFSDYIERFIEALNLNFIVKFFSLIGSILGFIWNILETVFGGIWSFFELILNIIKNAFEINPFLAFGGLIIIGVIIMLIYITIIETGAWHKVFELFKKAIYWLIGSPERFRLRINSFYRRLNHSLTKLLVGEARLHTRTQVYFKRVVLYTFFLSLYSFLAGIFVGVNPEDYGTFDTVFARVAFTSTVLFVAGVISGTAFFAFVSRVLDLFNRKKYIAPQFIKDDTVDQDAIDKHIKDDEDRIREELKVTEEDIEAAEAERKAKKAAKKQKSKEEAE